MSDNMLYDKSQTLHLSTKHIKHRDASANIKPNEQLSRLFIVAQTPWLIVFQVMFIDDDAT